MTNLITNMKISRKLAVLVCSGLGPVICLGALSIWGLAAIRGAVDEAQSDADKMIIAQHAAANMGRVTSIVGHIVLGEKCETCHGVATGGDRAHQAAIVKEYLNLLSDLKAAESDSEGRRLVGELESVGAHWHDINTRVLEMSRAGRRKDAVEAYRSESIPAYAPVEKALQDYLAWQQPRMAEKKTRVGNYTSRIPWAVALLAFVGFTIALSLGIAISRGISRPFNAAMEHISAVAEGDVTREVDPQHLKRADEFGDMARAVQTMSANLRDVLKEINSGIEVLSSASTELSGNSRQMSDGSREASEKTHSVAAAAEEMSANAITVAAAMEQTTTSLTHVSGSTEQMTATIGEIAQNSEKARNITGQATIQATRITEQIHQLGQAAREIGKVTETITEISSQTNLLALNATIEAARAGAAGKEIGRASCRERV